MDKEKEAKQLDFNKLALATVIGVILLGGAVYGAYLYSQRQAGGIILPGGVTYLGSTPTPKAVQNPSTPTPLAKFTVGRDVEWKIYKGVIYPFSFSYPSTLPLVVFVDDKTDSVAINWENIPPQINILLNMEFIDKRDAKYLKQAKIEYVKDWYKFFDGLKGVSKVETFTNANGLIGYKAWYINLSDSTPNIDVFFEVPHQQKLMIHLANGILDPTIFDRIVDSVKWSSNKPMITPKPT